MMSIPFLGLILSGFFYLAGAVFYLSAFFQENGRSEKSAFICVWCGFVCASIYLGFEAIEHGLAFPILNFAHVLAFFAWALA